MKASEPPCRCHRKAYQRALAVPMERLEPLWRAYEQFEMAGSNKLLAHISVNHQCRLLNHLAAATGKRIKGPW